MSCQFWPLPMTGTSIPARAQGTKHGAMNYAQEQETFLSPLLRHFFFKGYECIKILIATCLTGLKGLMKYKAGVALKRKIVFPLFSTINVCGEKRERERKERVNHFCKTLHNMSANGTIVHSECCTVPCIQALVSRMYTCSLYVVNMLRSRAQGGRAGRALFCHT